MTAARPTFAAIVVSVILMSSLAFLDGLLLAPRAHSAGKKSRPPLPRARLLPPRLPWMPGRPPMHHREASTPTASSAPLSLDSPGFVLQLPQWRTRGMRMRCQRPCHQKTFPAFVFKHSADSLYRVAVGPVPDADSAAKTKSELEQQGFKTPS